MKSEVCVILFLMSAFTFGQNKICFTYDDMPVVSYGINYTVHQEEIMDKLIASLNKNNIPAIGFVNEKKVWNETGIDNFQVKLLNKWVNGGLNLGNHTYSHYDYNNVSFADYSKDLLKGGALTNQILYKKGKALKYFRHPFLHVGNTKEKADSLEQFLTDHKYITAPVTIDNDDYLFAVVYKRAYEKKDSIMMALIRNDFINYIEDKIKYYEKQSNALFGRNINHILLLHASLFNSDCVETLADMLRKNNYSFVSIDEALKDEAYKTPVTKFGNWGISWIDRWALSQGKKGDFFKDEPMTPEYIKKLAE